MANIPFATLHGTPTGIMTLRVMKAERLDDLLNHYVWDEPLMLQLPQEIRERLLLYIIHGSVDSEAFYRKMASITNPDLQSTAMSLAQQLHQEGRQEGRQEGQQEGWQKAIIETLEVRFEGIPSGLAEAIREIHEEPRLSQLLRQALTAPSLETFACSL